MQNETLKEAFADIERRYMERWRGTSVQDAEVREYAWLAVNTLDDLSKRLHTWLVEADAEAKKLEEQRKAKNRNGRYYA